MHRSHEYLAKVAIGGLRRRSHPSLLGNLKPGDIPADVRTHAIAVLTDKYFVGKTVVQAGYPLDMRYAGPRRPCCMRSSGRTTAARTRSSGATTRAWAASTVLRRAPYLRRHPEGALETEPLKID